MYNSESAMKIDGGALDGHSFVKGMDEIQSMIEKLCEINPNNLMVREVRNSIAKGINAHKSEILSMNIPINTPMTEVDGIVVSKETLRGWVSAIDSFEYSANQSTGILEEMEKVLDNK